MHSFKSKLAATLASAAVLALASGCTTPPRNAVPQDGLVSGKPMKFGGTYLPREKQLTLMVNEEPVMRGTFPPYTPTLNLNADYKGNPVRAECYFSSVLSEKGGIIGIVASGVQSAAGKSSDSCKMIVQDKTVATLNF